MSARRNQLVAAFNAHDHAAIRKLGWFEIWEACATWWKPRQTATAAEMVPYAQLLGDETPEQVLQALRELADEWRPSSAAIRGHLHQHDQDDARVDVGRSQDRAGTPQATQATANAHHAGERPCTCPTRQNEWEPDQHHVLRCRTCHGLEQGQVYNAEDVGLLPPGKAA